MRRPLKIMSRICLACLSDHAVLISGQSTSIRTKLIAQMIKTMDSIQNKFALQIPEMQPDFYRLKGELLQERQKKAEKYNRKPQLWRDEMNRIISRVSDEIARDKVFVYFNRLLSTDASTRHELVAFFAESSSESLPASFHSRSKSPARPSPAQSEEEVLQDVAMLMANDALLDLVQHLKSNPHYSRINSDEWKEIVRKLQKRQYETLASLSWSVDNAFRSIKHELKGTKDWSDAKRLIRYWKKHYAIIEKQRRFEATQSSQSSEESEPQPAPIVYRSSSEEEQLPRFATDQQQKDDVEKHLTRSDDHMLIERTTPFTVRDLRTLIDTSFNQRTGKWQFGELNDEAMNAYVMLINDRNLESNVKLFYTVYAFNTFFYSVLFEDARKYAFDRVQNWTTRANLDVFSLKKLLVPVNLPRRHHWVLAVINMEEKRFEFYDSLGESGEEVLGVLRRWLVDEARVKRDGELNIDEWTNYQPRDSVPQQNNAVDCGVFTSQFADCLAEDRPFDFTQDDIPELRYYMAISILAAELRGSKTVSLDAYPRSRLSAEQARAARDFATEYVRLLDKYRAVTDERKAKYRTALQELLAPGSELRKFYETITKQDANADLLLLPYWYAIQKKIGELELRRYKRIEKEHTKLQQEIAILSKQQGRLVNEYDEWKKFGEEKLRPLDIQERQLFKQLRRILENATKRGYVELFRDVLGE